MEACFRMSAVSDRIETCFWVSFEASEVGAFGVCDLEITMTAHGVYMQVL